MRESHVFDRRFVFLFPEPRAKRSRLKPSSRRQHVAGKRSGSRVKNVECAWNIFYCDTTIVTIHKKHSVFCTKIRNVSRDVLWRRRFDPGQSYWRVVVESVQKLRVCVTEWNHDTHARSFSSSYVLTSRPVVPASLLLGTSVFINVNGFVSIIALGQNSMFTSIFCLHY